MAPEILVTPGSTVFVGVPYFLAHLTQRQPLLNAVHPSVVLNPNTPAQLGAQVKGPYRETGPTQEADMPTLKSPLKADRPTTVAEADGCAHGGDVLCIRSC